MVGLKCVVVLLVNLSPKSLWCLRTILYATMVSLWISLPLLGIWVFSLIA